MEGSEESPMLEVTSRRFHIFVGGDRMDYCWSRLLRKSAEDLSVSASVLWEDNSGPLAFSSLTPAETQTTQH